ncbi:MAG TPA: hypothetical protein VIK86_05550 [Candidatus Paceibacterota bacterium]
MLTVEEVKKLKVAKVKCNKSLLFFTRYFFVKRQRRKFVVSGHHEIIINALEKVVNGEITRLIINIAPRYGKTEIAVKNFIAWCLSNNPRAKFIHLSYSDDLALDNSEEIKDLVISEEFQLMYPNIKLKKDSKSKKKWYTTEGGGVYATSASGQVTGFGAGRVDQENELLKEIDFIDCSENFGGAIIIDDPIKPDDVETVVREKVNNKFDTTLRNRVNSRKTPIIIIMQRLHPMDLCGYLQDVEKDVWTVISLPVLNENNEPLWEFKHTYDELIKLKNINSYVFGTQYMQNPQPKEGLLLPIDDLNFQDLSQIPVEKIMFKLSFLDPAEKGGDHYSLPLLWVYLDEVSNKLYVLVKYVIHNTNGIKANTSNAKIKLKEFLIEQLIIESNGIGVGAVIELERDIRNDLRVSGIPENKNKEMEILSNYEFVRDNFIFDSNYINNPEYKLFISHLTQYSKEGDNKHKKDAIDVICKAARFIKLKYNRIIYG